SAARDVSHPTNPVRLEDGLKNREIAPMRLQERVGHGDARLRQEFVQLEILPLEQNLESERVTIGVQSVGLEPDRDVAATNPRSVENPLFVDDTDDEPDEVVLGSSIDPRHFRRFAAEECTPNRPAGLCHAGDERLNDSRLEATNADVIEEE